MPNTTSVNNLHETTAPNEPPVLSKIEAAKLLHAVEEGVRWLPQYSNDVLWPAQQDCGANA